MCVGGLEARQKLEGRGNSGAPGFAWTPAACQGPPLADASFPLGPDGWDRGAGWRRMVPVPHVWGFGCRWPGSSPLPWLWVSARRPGISALGDPKPGPAVPPPTHRLYLLLQRAEGVEAAAASSSVQRGAVGPQPFPAAATALSREAHGWLAAAIARGAGGRWGRGRRATTAQRRDTATHCPAGEQQLCSSQLRESKRAGGRPKEEEFRVVGNGCHVAQVDRRPLPLCRDL